MRQVQCPSRWETAPTERQPARSPSGGWSRNWGHAVPALPRPLPGCPSVPNIPPSGLRCVWIKPRRSSCFPATLQHAALQTSPSALPEEAPRHPRPAFEPPACPHCPHHAALLGLIPWPGGFSHPWGLPSSLASSRSSRPGSFLPLLLPQPPLGAGAPPADSAATSASLESRLALHSPPRQPSLQATPGHRSTSSNRQDLESVSFLRSPPILLQLPVSQHPFRGRDDSASFPTAWLPRL